MIDELSIDDLEQRIYRITRVNLQSSIVNLQSKQGIEYENLFSVRLYSRISRNMERGGNGMLTLVTNASERRA